MAIDPEHAQLLGRLESTTKSTQDSVKRIEDALVSHIEDSRSNDKELYNKHNELKERMDKAEGGFKMAKWMGAGGGLTGLGAALKAFFGSGGAQ